MTRTIAAFILFSFVFVAALSAQPVEVRSGDIILTRNADSVGNPNGYFNHATIAAETPQGMVIVEMQRDFNTAIAVTVDGFFRRCPEYLILRYSNPFVASNAGRFALTQVGVPEYRLLASLKPCVKLGVGDNCVSLVRRCYIAAGLLDQRWIKPDGVFKFSRSHGFRVVAHFRYGDYEIPHNFYEGLIQ